jgi:hypothetical protein
MTKRGLIDFFNEVRVPWEDQDKVKALKKTWQCKIDEDDFTLSIKRSGSRLNKCPLVWFKSTFNLNDCSSQKADQ